MPEHSVGDSAQTRIIVEQVVDAAIVRFKDKEAQESVLISPGLKWLLGIVSVLVAAFCIWSVRTLNEVQLSVAEIKMQLGSSGAIEARFQEINRRIDRLERINATEERRGEE